MRFSAPFSAFWTGAKFLYRKFVSHKPTLADEATRIRRLHTCMACPMLQLSKAGELECRACSCLIDLKVMLVTSACPERKW